MSRSSQGVKLAYVFGGPLHVAPVRRFVTRFSRTFSQEALASWETSPNTTAVRAIADPQNDSAYLVGVLLLSFQKRHLRIEELLVDPARRRQRIATNMFYRMVMDPRCQQFQTISVFVPDTCDEGIAFLKFCKFEAISVIPAVSSTERDQYLFTWSFSNLHLPGENSDATRLSSLCQHSGGSGDFGRSLRHRDSSGSGSSSGPDNP